MKRRSLMKAGVAAGGLAPTLAQSGCAHLAPGGDDEVDLYADLPDPAQVEDILRSLDKRLAWIDEHELPATLRPTLPADPTPAQAEKLDRFNQLFRSSLRTLYLTGRFLDLPDEIKAHPAVQERLWAAQPEMDQAVLGTTEMLESLDDDQLRAIQQRLKDNPDIGEQLAKLLDEPAREDGIPHRRRLSLRSSALDLVTRMAAQSPRLTIDPYVSRVRKVERRTGSDADNNRRLRSRGDADAFEAREQRLTTLARRWERRLAQNPTSAAPATPGSPPPTAPAPAQKTPGRKTLGVGGWIMGFGAGSMLLGLIFAGLAELTSVGFFTGGALLFGVTVGPLLIIIGLVVVLVAGIIMATE